MSKAYVPGERCPPHRWPDTVYAYLAGVLDADGSIFIAREAPGDEVRERFSLRISIGQVQPSALNLFCEVFGGEVKRYVPHRDTTFKSRQDMYKWTTYGERTKVVIEALGPYLLIKKDALAIAREFVALMTSKPTGKNPDNGQYLPIPEDNRRARRALWQRMHAHHKLYGKGYVRDRVFVTSLEEIDAQDR